MTIEALSPDYEFDRPDKTTTLDIQANPSTWFLVALVLKRLSFLPFDFSSSDSYTSYATPFPAQFQKEIADFFTTGIHQLPQQIRADRELIAAHLEHWMRELNLEPISLHDLELISHASSGTYYHFVDGEIQSVIKPIDEDILCLNNPHQPSLPGVHIPVRPSIPLYHSAERECSAYEISCLMGLSIVPPTVMAAIQSPDFYDVCKSIYNGELKELLHLFKMEKRAAELIEEGGVPPSLKICSIRDFVPHATTLHAFLWDETHSMDDVDPNDITAVNLMMWVLGNTDGHTGNILVYPKGVKEDGSTLYGLKLIDLCLALPQTNTYLLNLLPDLCETSLKLPPWAISSIQDYPLEATMSNLQKYGLSDCADALRERVEALQIFATQDLTMEEIDTRMRYLTKEKAAALDVEHSFEFPRYAHSAASSNLSPFSTWATTTTSTWLRG